MNGFDAHFIFPASCSNEVCQDQNSQADCEAFATPGGGYCKWNVDPPPHLPLSVHWQCYNPRTGTFPSPALRPTLATAVPQPLATLWPTVEPTAPTFGGPTHNPGDDWRYVSA